MAPIFRLAQAAACLLPWLLTTAAAVLLAGGCARSPGGSGPVTIVADPGPFGSVEEAASAEARVAWRDRDPRDDDACTACFAATELQRFLPGCLGIPADSVRVSSRLPERGRAIVVGRIGASPALDSLGIEPAAVPRAAGGFALRRLARERRDVIAVAGADREGALYGAYALLERFGLRFYGLGPAGTAFPASPAAWPESFSLSEAPAFRTRGFWAWEPRGHPELFLWMARNRLNLWTAADSAHVPLLRKLGMRLTGGGHTIQAEYLSPTRYFRPHPEWYGLRDGRRSPRIAGESGDNFCTSNPAARRELARNLVRALAGGALRDVDLLQVWMLDQGRWCECARCRQQGAPTDRTLDVAAEVADAVHDAGLAAGPARRVEVATLAYLETLPPPERQHPLRRASAGLTVTFFPYFRCYAHALADSSCVEMNRRLAASALEWSRGLTERARLTIGEYYNMGSFKSLPLVFPHVLSADLGWYRGLGAEGISYMHAPSRRWGSWTLHHWLFARVSWNPRTPADTLMDEFCDRYFPITSALMREHYRHLETASANIVALQHAAGVYGGGGPAGRLAEPSLPLFPLRHLREKVSHSETDDAPDLDEIAAALRSAAGALARARAGARDSIERRRLEEEAERFEYGQSVFDFYVALLRTAAAHRARDGDRAREEFARAAQAATRLRGVTDLVRVASSHANAANGLEASGATAGYEFFRGLYGTR